MTSETTKVKAKLSTLSSSLDELEAQLEPLFSQTLPETIVALETIQQAKLQTVLPYLVYDLIFIYLKAQGIDPRTHPVVPELDRVRQYFEKITNAEDPAKRKPTIDKAAAGRFIKHAITQAKAVKIPVDPSTQAGPSTSDVRVPVKMTSKMLERAQYEKELKERDEKSDEEDDLDVIEEDIDMLVDEEVVVVDKAIDSKGKGKGKQKEVTLVEDDDVEASVGGKRRRPAVDPFAGYGDDAEDKSDKAKKNKSAASTPNVIDVDDESNDVNPTDPVIVQSPASGAVDAKATKKAKRAAKKRNAKQ